MFAYFIHDLAQLDFEPQAAKIGLVVSGHSHAPKVETRGGVIFLNPGSCGARRFRLPICVGEVRITGKRVTARTIELFPIPAG